MRAWTHDIASSWAPVRAKNGVTRVSEYVLLNPDGLHHALALAVPMPFFAGSHLSIRVPNEKKNAP